MDTVATSARADVDHRVVDPCRAGLKDAVCTRDPQGESIDQDIAILARVKGDFTPYSWYADTIAIPANASNHAFNQIRRAWVVNRAKTQRIKRSNGPCAHGEDIAQDATNTGCG